MSMSNI